MHSSLEDTCIARNLVTSRTASMEWLGPLIALLAVLFLVSRGVPGQNWLVIIAVMLAVTVAVLWLERSGLWPQNWRAR